MSIDINKKDFESAIETVETKLVDAFKFLDKDFLDSIELLITEYQGHLRDDIEGLMDKVSELENEVESLKQDIEDYENEARGNDQ